MLVQSMQNALTKDVHNKLSYYVEIQWDKGASIHICVKKQAVLKMVYKIKKSYTKYYQQEYTVKRLLVKDVRNKNPHINIPLPKTGFTF
jgi:hypothetical protein